MENTLSIIEFYNYLVENKFLSGIKPDTIKKTPSQTSTRGGNPSFLRTRIAIKHRRAPRNYKGNINFPTKEDEAWEIVKPKYYSLLELYHKNKYKEAAAFVVDALKLIVCTISGGVLGALIVLLEYLYKFITEI